MIGRNLLDNSRLISSVCFIQYWVQDCCRSESTGLYFTISHWSRYLGCVVTIPESFYVLTKILPDRVFIHTKERCGGAISVTERSWAGPISKVEPHISERFCAILWWGSFGAVLTSIGSRDGNVSWGRESAMKGLNTTSGAQFAALPLIKPVV